MNISKDRAFLSSARATAEESWAQTCAGLGGASWAALAVLARVGVARIGSIELIFLFGPLVIVPLGMELLRIMGATWGIEIAARRVQPIAAGLAVGSLLLPPGRVAALLSSGWMFVCLLMALGGVRDLFSATLSEQDGKSPTSPNTGEKWGTHTSRSSLLLTSRIALAIAKIDLFVGGAWFVASRLGLRPMGIQEPIGLLTAVHFHFAGFATALIAAAVLQFAGARGALWLNWLVAFVVGMPFVVAAGFVISPVVRMVAAVGFGLGVAGLAVVLRSRARRAQSSTARLFLQVAAASVFAGMVLAVVYAIAVLRGSDVLPIPQMARTHGVLNAVGFCMFGLLGWIIESNPRTE